MSSDAFSWHLNENTHRFLIVTDRKKMFTIVSGKHSELYYNTD